MLDARTVSVALFGHAYRLDLLSALAAAGREGVVISELARRRNVSASVFYPPLHGLEELELVTRSEPEIGTRRVRYVATESPAWVALERLTTYAREALVSVKAA